MYSAKEIFSTLQGEGYHSGRAAVFCRFAGCNLWNGRDKHRATAICQFCDTDFVGTDGPGGGAFETADELASAIEQTWAAGSTGRFAVLTGGEPLLQLDQGLIDALHSLDFEIAIETNGTKSAPAGVDWICVSPKAGARMLQRSGNELKLVYPQRGLEPAMFEHLPFEHFFLQPMDGPRRTANTEAAVEACRRNPLWKLGIQSQKYIGIP